MAFQGLSPERSKIEQLMEIDGAVMVGTKIKASFELVPEVYVLHMDNVLATKVDLVFTVS
jgi:leucyl-tRNA synthetase